MARPSHPVIDSLEKDLEFYNDSIKEVANDIINEEVSSYPVFIAHEHEVQLGEVILDKDELGCKWTINATVLDELVEKGIVQEDKKEEFKNVYKDPKKYMCIFLISEKGGNFIFMPYNDEKEHLKKEESNGSNDDG